MLILMSISRSVARFVNILAVVTLVFLFSTSCSIFVKSETPENLIAKASHQKVFLAPYDRVWQAAHMVIKYTIAAENQDYGTIETDYVKAVDGWVPPYKKKPDYPSSRYKLFFTFVKGETRGKESTRVTIEKKIDIFKDVISDTKTVPSDGTEEEAIFYRLAREIIILNALDKVPVN